MSIIEQAARRLEQLRRSGIDVPAVVSTSPLSTSGAADGETVVRVAGKAQRASNDVAPLNEGRFEREEVRRSRGVNIELARLAAAGYLTPDSPRTRLADEYRVIKRPLLLNVQGKATAQIDRANLIMVTSALPGEGKTFSSINLAMSIAMEVDHTVLLVDADVARPTMLGRLGLPNTRGLLDVLTEPGLTLGESLLKTNVERLSLLPAGTQHPRATELLASDGMTRLLEEIAGRYSDRIVIFDAPPLLPSTESRVLASHMGQVVVVVEAERTQRSALTQALATLENCPVVMTLLNKVAGSDVGSYYGYYGNAPA